MDRERARIIRVLLVFAHCIPVIVLGEKRIRLSSQAKFVLYWLGRPETLRELLKEDYPPILIRNGEILYRDTREKMEFEGDGMERAKIGIAELEAKGLIKADRIGDIELTEKGKSKAGIVRGVFPKNMRERICVIKKSAKEIEEARQRLLKEKEAMRDR